MLSMTEKFGPLKDGNLKTKLMKHEVMLKNMIFGSK